MPWWCAARSGRGLLDPVLIGMDGALRLTACDTALRFIEVSDGDVGGVFRKMCATGRSRPTNDPR